MTGEQRPFQSAMLARIVVVANIPVIRGIQVETAFQPIFRPLTGEVQRAKMGPMGGDLRKTAFGSRAELA